MCLLSITTYIAHFLCLVDQPLLLLIIQYILKRKVCSVAGQATVSKALSKYAMLHIGYHTIGDLLAFSSFLQNGWLELKKWVVAASLYPQRVFINYLDTFKYSDSLLMIEIMVGKHCISILQGNMKNDYF